MRKYKNENYVLSFLRFSSKRSENEHISTRLFFLVYQFPTRSQSFDISKFQTLQVYSTKQEQTFIIDCYIQDHLKYRLKMSRTNHKAVLAS